ncbi:MAG TPA: hypothetical protein PKM88_14915, partial [bacterium]|nr:hypothetical protein [bacterium]
DTSALATGLAYIEVLLARGQFTVADRVAQQVLAVAPDNLTAQQALARSAAERGQALPPATAALLAARTGVTEQYLLGYDAVRRGDTVAALTALALALADDDDDPFARELYERCALTALRTDHPTRRALGEWRLRQARRAVDAGDEPVARHQFARSIRLDPQSAPARFACARFLERRGLTASAGRQFAAAVDLDARSGLYRDCAREAADRRARALAARENTGTPPPAAPVRLAIFVYADSLEDYCHPGAPQLLAELLAEVLAQQPQVQVVAARGDERELALADAEAAATALQAGALLYLRLRETPTTGTLDGVLVLPEGARPVLPLHADGSGARWSEQLCRQVRMLLARRLPLAGVVLRVDERAVLVNLGRAHGLAVNDRLTAGAAGVALRITECDEWLARGVADRQAELTRLRRNDAVRRTANGITGTGGD